MGLFDFLSKADPKEDQKINTSTLPNFEDWFKDKLTKHLPIQPLDDNENSDKWLSTAFYKFTIPFPTFDWRAAVDSDYIMSLIEPGKVENVYLNILNQLSNAQSGISKVLEDGEELILITPLLPGSSERNFSLKGLAVLTDKRFFLFDDKIATELKYSEINDVKHMGEVEGYASPEGLMGGDANSGFYVPVLITHTSTLPMMPLQGYDMDENIRLGMTKPSSQLMVLFSNSGLRDEFIEALKKAMSNKTENAPNKILSVSHNDNGAAYYNVGELDKALIEFNKAIDIDPVNVVAYINRGRIWRQKNDQKKALADFEKAIEIDPNYAASYENRGTLLISMEEVDKGLADLSKVIELQPDDAFAYYNRANVWYIAKKDYEKAEADFLRAIELSPADPKYRSAFEIFLKNKIAELENNAPANQKAG